MRPAPVVVPPRGRGQAVIYVPQFPPQAKEMLMIEVKHSESVVRLVLNRPDKANALTAPMIETLIAEIGAARAAGAAALILTGVGRVFSAGADLEAARAGLAVSPLWESLSGAVADFPGLTIAALNGTAAGGALGMVLACDLRIAVAGASVFYPVMKLGFAPQPSDPQRMGALIGPARSKMILMAGQKIDAATALDWGLIDRITAPEALLPEAMALTEAARAAPPGHAARLKAMMP